MTQDELTLLREFADKCNTDPRSHIGQALVKLLDEHLKMRQIRLRLNLPEGDYVISIGDVYSETPFNVTRMR